MLHSNRREISGKGLKDPLFTNTTFSNMGKKDPNAPKHSMTAYTFYMVERRPQLKAQFPDWPFGEFDKTIGAEAGR